MNSDVNNIVFKEFSEIFKHKSHLLELNLLLAEYNNILRSNLTYWCYPVVTEPCQQIKNLFILCFITKISYIHFFRFAFRNVNILAACIQMSTLGPSNTTREPRRKEPELWSVSY